MSPLPPGAMELLAEAGVSGEISAARLSGGMNNQVFRVTGGGRTVVLKSYFHDAHDSRDRLGAEWGFLTAAQDLGVGCVAAPLARATAHHLGVYSFLAGRLPVPEDVSAAAVDQALAFVTRLNPASRAVEHGRLPAASEACFSGAQHLGTVDRRLDRLSRALGDSPVEQEAARFLRDDLGPLWTRIRDDIATGLARLGIDPAAEIPAAERILSPSDFGFHNALKTEDGCFAFLDFEYAGWDDPAKLVGDAFNQVKVPLPQYLYPVFRDTVAARSPDPAVARRRFDLLRPLYAVKWVLIILNDFIPLDERRRAFAGTVDRRAPQLTAARAKFAALAGEYPSLTDS